MDAYDSGRESHLTRDVLARLEAMPSVCEVVLHRDCPSYGFSRGLCLLDLCVIRFDEYHIGEWADRKYRDEQSARQDFQQRSARHSRTDWSETPLG